MALAKASLDPTFDLARLLGSRRRQLGPADLLGLEHEYVVRTRWGQVDFRRLIQRLPVDGARLDPYDRYAHRCRWGGNITADDLEAEVAIPPVALAPGATSHLVEAAAHARASLRGIVPDQYTLDGYSTHLSVAIPDELNDMACRIFARTFAAGMILLTDRAVSSGLLIHPRRGRVELGTEFLEGRQLRAAAVYAAGGVIACASGATGHPTRIPPPLDLSVVPARRRFGWFVDRAAFGLDLVARGRGASLRLASGALISAQEQLTAAWQVARDALGDRVSPADLADADLVVSGALPLPSERLLGSDATTERPPLGVSPFGDLLLGRARPGFHVTAVLATWDFAIFHVRQDGTEVFASIPRDSLGRFLQLLDEGELDGVLTRALRGVGARPHLSGWERALRPGLYRTIGPRLCFIPPERDPSGAPWIPPDLRGPQRSVDRLLWGGPPDTAGASVQTERPASRSSSSVAVDPRPGKIGIPVIPGPSVLPIPPAVPLTPREPARPTPAGGIGRVPRRVIVTVAVVVILGFGVTIATVGGLWPGSSRPAPALPSACPETGMRAVMQLAAQDLVCPTPTPLPVATPSPEPSPTTPTETAEPLPTPIPQVTPALETTAPVSYFLYSSATVEGNVAGCQLPIHFAWVVNPASPGTPSGVAVIVIKGPGITRTFERLWGPDGIALDYVVQLTKASQVWSGQIVTIGGVAPTIDSTATVTNVRNDRC